VVTYFVISHRRTQLLAMAEKYQNLDGPLGMASVLEKEKARRKRSIWIVCFRIPHCSTLTHCSFDSLAWLFLGHLFNRGTSGAHRCSCHSLVFRHPPRL
jgi:hypothetical protein